MTTDRIKIRSTLLAAAALAAVLLAPARPAAADAKAEEIAAKTLAAMGGQKAWDEVHFIRFTFAVNRHHHWDKWTGRHRVEFIDRKGDHYLVLENINTRAGRAWKNGVELSGEEGAQTVQRGYETWINDTYWLIMPYKLRDPGVILTYAGEETVDGVLYDKLHLAFENVGVTPKDQYWAYINRETGLMDRWAYILESYEPGQEATHWQWKGWQRYGKVLLAPERIEVKAGRKLPLDDIAVLDTLPDTIFTSSEALVKPNPPTEAPKPSTR